jgi:hypothetical protein
MTAREGRGRVGWATVGIAIAGLLAGGLGAVVGVYVQLARTDEALVQRVQRNTEDVGRLRELTKDFAPASELVRKTEFLAELRSISIQLDLIIKRLDLLTQAQRDLEVRPRRPLRLHLEAVPGGADLSQQEAPRPWVLGEGKP